MNKKMSKKSLNLKLKIWRQQQGSEQGSFVDYQLNGVSPDISFLEMLDFLNEQLEANGEESVSFEHDCREGICGSCGMMINGKPHGGNPGTTVCQLHMRSFEDGETILIEPWRAGAFPVVKDLIVDRSAFDRIVAAGAFISVRTGAAPDANAIPVRKDDADVAFEAAACIGCGACVASCKNSSASLFTAAKISHFGHLPQGAPERKSRARGLVEQMKMEGFGHCTNESECEAACPKEISVDHITFMNREYIKSSFSS